MTQDSQSLARLIQEVVPNPQSDPAVRSQILQLAEKNLQLPGVVEALVASVAQTRDSDLRRRLAAIVGNLDTSRFSDIRLLHDALIQSLQLETDRAGRVRILERLAAGLSQDERLVGVFLEHLSRPELSEPEREAALSAVSSLPTVAEGTALQALKACVRAPAWLQELALRLAWSRPTWSDDLTEALRPYLRREVASSVRESVYARLREGRRLTASHAPLLIDILNQATDPAWRRTAMRLMGSLRPWTDEMVAAVIRAGAEDADETVRQEAVRWQSDLQQLPDDQRVRLAEMLSHDVSGQVRCTVLAVLKTSVRLPGVRNAVAEAFRSHPSLFGDEEFGALLELLGPYVSRDPSLRRSLLGSLPGNPRVQQRALVIALVAPQLTPEEAAEFLTPLFKSERDEGVRRAMFERLRPLAVARYEALALLYAEEAAEPASEFRLECARAVAGCAEERPAVVPFLEDILLHDQDRELIRTCLEGYLRPRVARRFAPLLAVVRNEAMDPGARQMALEEIFRVGLQPEERDQLTQALALVKPGVLRPPN